MTSTCCDPWYTAFSRIRGYSLRLSPKVTKSNPDKSSKDHYIDDPSPKPNQFVQRPLLNPDGSQLMMSQRSGCVENPAIISILHFLTNVQNYITSIPNIVDKLKSMDEGMLDEVTQYTKMEYNLLLIDYYIVSNKNRSKIGLQKCDDSRCPCQSDGELAISSRRLQGHKYDFEKLNKLSTKIYNKDVSKWHNTLTKWTMPEW